jgi:acetylornithine deacetylase/succinyl-diaminopimelate desuccinylase-like protein
MGPSVGDDSVAVASLPALGTVLAESPGTAPVLLVATVGEEGLGNLAGALHAVNQPPMPLGAFIAIEGNYLGRLATTGVGSSRHRVTVRTLGGHAWEAPTAPSAIHQAAAMVTALAALPVVPGASSLNVGRFSGGEAINARAREASFDLELRASEVEQLAGLEAAVDAVLSRSRADAGPGVEIHVQGIGKRPAGRLDPGHPLLAAAKAAHEEAGWPCVEMAASTDANAAHAAGIPALALGVTTGSGEHTPGEWVDIAPIGEGLAIIVGSVVRYERPREDS